MSGEGPVQACPMGPLVEIPSSTGPCSCWRGPVALHDFHCCFTYYDAGQNVVTCGHDVEGMRVHLATLTPSSVVSR